MANILQYIFREINSNIYFQRLQDSAYVRDNSMGEMKIKLMNSETHWPYTPSIFMNLIQGEDKVILPVFKKDIATRIDEPFLKDIGIFVNALSSSNTQVIIPTDINEILQRYPNNTIYSEKKPQNIPGLMNTIFGPPENPTEKLKRHFVTYAPTQQENHILPKPLSLRHRVEINIMKIFDSFLIRIL